MKIDVLDHGFVRLVSYTQPVEEAGYHFDPDVAPWRDWTGDLEIVRNARVSYNADWRPAGKSEDDERPDAPSKDERLIHYLMKNRHTTPFEAMVFTFEVQAPIFVFRQWHRHRTWSYNEVSARYTELPELFYVPKAEHIGEQSKIDKQARSLVGGNSNLAISTAEAMRVMNSTAFKLYDEFLKAGVPRELARTVLPLATYSRMFATVDLHNLFHFLTLRLDDHAQYEIRVYAEALLQLIEPVCPVAVRAFKSLINYRGEVEKNEKDR